MKRRDFLKTAAGVSSTLALFGLPSPVQADAEKKPSPMPKERPLPFSDELEEMTVSELQAGMESGKFTSHSITNAYLKRIEKIDKDGPSINSVIEINPDALVIAEKMDKERKAGRVLGPLHGIPIIIKDNIDTADRMMTTAGSLALVGNIPKQDSFVAKKLREAGAVILAKANLSEWANFRSTRSTSGWSGRGGQTLNPYILDRNPCGSSSGSGVAVSANLCTLSIGTETDGSIVCPATANGLVGIKPTVGLVSRAGIIPISHRQDTAGPMARTVTDATILLSALAGVDERDETTQESKGKAHSDYTQFLDTLDMKGVRIGVARGLFGFHDQVDKLMEEALSVMKDLGATLVDPADIETAGKFDDAEFEALIYEFKYGLNQYLTFVGNDVPVHNLDELIAFNEANKDKEMPYFGQEIFMMAKDRGGLETQEYCDYLKDIVRQSRDEGIDATLAKHNVDAIVAPTGGPAWLTDWVNGDHFIGGSSSPAASAGYPNITVPAGFVHGLPVGISFFAGGYSEPALIRLAYAFEQATKHRRPPQFLERAPLG
jgi:amidase